MTPLTPEQRDRRLASAPAQYSSLIAAEPMRFAVIYGSKSGITPDKVAAYLPSSYGVLESFEVRSPRWPDALENDIYVVIGGHDNAGWTLDGYVLPRLASGLYFGEEITTGSQKNSEES